MSAPSPLALAVDRLRRDGLVAYPTETVWGLGARAQSRAAVERLQAWKGRAADQPLSILVSGLPALERLGFELSPAARELAERFWPGPLTLVTRGPAGAGFAPGVARDDGAVGVRCSPHPAAAALVRAAEDAGLGAITSTSLNRAGEPPARTRAEATALCAADGPLLWAGSGAGDEAGGQEPSTVVDVSRGPARVLRRGPVSLPTDTVGGATARGERGGPEVSESA